MKILVLEHLAIEPAAMIGEVLEENDFQLERYDIEQLSAPSPLDDYAGMVIMGGPMSANDDHLSYIRAELDLIRDSLRRGMPMLGICLGSQLMARAAGGKIHAAPIRETGWFPVTPTAAAAKDPLFGALPADGATVFQWHGETFSLPDDATLMATHPVVPHQAFRLGPGQYGLQFHVEVDETIIERWLEAGETERTLLGEDGIRQLREATDLYLKPMQSLCQRMVLGWIPLLRRQPASK